MTIAARAIWDSVTARHIVLAAGAALVFGLAVYLFLEVRARPAAAQAPATATARADVDEPAPPTERPVPRPTTAAPAVARVESPAEDTRPSATNPEPPPPAPPMLQPEGGITKLGYRLDAIMAEANKAYDRGDIDEAKSIAQKVLAKLPNNSRMLRIMVSASCIEADAAEAQKYYNQLPAADRETMRIRCARDHQITLVDPPSK